MLNLIDNGHIKEEKKKDNFKRISFNNKNLRSIPIIKNFNKIEILSLNDNEISTLSFCQDLPNLKELYMKNNNIANIKEIDYLSLCKNLHTIYLKGNPIQLNNNQIYIKKIKRAVCSIKNIDGLKIIPNKKLNLYIFLKNSSKNMKIKHFNGDIILKNIKTNYINKHNNNSESINERVKNNNNKIYSRDYKSVDNNQKNFHHIKLNKYNKGKKICNYVNFNNTINKNENKFERRRKSDLSIIKRIFDKSAENSCINFLNIDSREENQNSIENTNIINSAFLLLNGLNLLQLKQIENYVNKKLSSKLYKYNN